MSLMPADSDDRLAPLRAQLDLIDQDILEAVAKRLEVVDHIRRVKIAEGRSVFDRGREKAVFDRWRVLGAQLDLPEVTTQRIVQAMVDASHLAQMAQDTADHAVEAASERVLIVGGQGQMGQFFARVFTGAGHVVHVLEKDDGDRAQAVADADIVMLAVPMAQATAVALEVAPLVRPDALLLDINSLKRDICAVMQEHCAGEVLGTHPMFGPTVSSLRRQKVVLCHLRDGPRGARFVQELGRLGADLIVTDPATHDRMMAVVQVLVHFRTVVMGDALRRTGVPVEESLRFTSPIYRLELAIVGRLFTQDPNLYGEIEMSNPYAEEVRGHFVKATSELAEIVAAGDRQAFNRRFREVARYFERFGDQAMALSDFLIDRLVEQP